LAQIEDKVMEKMTDRPLSKKEKKNIATKVAVGALKFSVLKQSPGKDIIFDFDKSLSFEGDSGPYLQYTAVRAKSVLDKAHELKIGINTKKKDDNILVLERMLYQLPEVVERAGQDKSPQLLVTYLSDLAASFNSFYSSTKILDESNESASYYLGLTKATRRVLKNGLSILGILVPDKM
ncbi:MAG TPA: DALR anticodon-binding domain-containing protein, partial [Candidatus Paceibacterota bacterium]